MNKEHRKHQEPGISSKQIKQAFKSLDDRTLVINQRLSEVIADVFNLKAESTAQEKQNSKLKTQITGFGFWLVILLGIEFFRFILWWIK